MKKNLIVDCFAGGGGASVGIEMALGRPVDIAINHDPDAILMHKTNHPNTLHLTEDIFKVNLRKYVKDQHVALMWASPVAKQVARIGNSVVPIMAQKLVEANCPYLKVGERVPNLNIDDSQEQLRFA